MSTSNSKGSRDEGNSEYDLTGNANILDLIPIEQKVVTYRQLYIKPKRARTNSLVKVYSILLITTIFSIAAFYAFRDTINNCSCYEHTELKLIRYELANLNKEKWRNMLKIDRILNFQLLKQVNSRIETALGIYDADKMAMIDYALESAGGLITSLPDTIPLSDTISYNIFGIINLKYPSNPRLLIQPGTLPGQCFAFKGHNGRIRIQLAHTIIVTAVTIEHANSNLIVNVNSAPKDFNVYGLHERDCKEGKDLGRFTYKINRKPLQTFNVKDNLGTPYKHIELHVLTNHGNNDYTCIYRFRIHGRPFHKEIDSGQDRFV